MVMPLPVGFEPGKEGAGAMTGALTATVTEEVTEPDAFVAVSV